MDQDKWMLLNTLLILLVALLHFLLRRGPQNDAVQALEARLAEVEQALADLQQHLLH